MKSWWHICEQGGRRFIVYSKYTVQQREWRVLSSDARTAAGHERASAVARQATTGPVGTFSFSQHKPDHVPTFGHDRFGDLVALRDPFLPEL